MDDLFISYVAADKPVAQALADKLQQNSLTVTFIQLGLGDSLTYRMEQGFRDARYGVLILSPDFFKKPWPRSELDKIAMIDREFDDQTRLFPLWHEVTQSDIARYSSALARRVGASTDAGMDTVAAELLEVVRPEETVSSYGAPLLKTQSAISKQVVMPELANGPSLNDPRRLYDALTQYFSKGELADLAWDMNIDYEEIPGDTKSAKARELIAYSQRRGRLDELSQQVHKRRPFIS